MKACIPWFLIVMAIAINSEKCPIWWLPPLIVLVISVVLAVVAFRSGMRRGAHF